MFDTFIMQSPVKPDHGVGEVWKSKDDLHTVEGPIDVDLNLPGLKWNGSTNDFGKPFSSARAHRSVIELPNGDLLLLVYTRFQSDTAPSSYMPTMLKSRVIVVRSQDGGTTWAYLATVGVECRGGHRRLWRTGAPSGFPREACRTSDLPDAHGPRSLSREFRRSGRDLEPAAAGEISRHRTSTPRTNGSICLPTRKRPDIIPATR